MQTEFDVIVVGGGAAGLMAAGRAAARGKKVLLLEKNKELGEKLKITGGGRCNTTNAEFDERALLRNYGKAEQFLYSAFSQFGVNNTFSFFESKGLPLVVQARKRAFPHTERALDVYNVLAKYIREGKVQVKTNSPVTRVVAEATKITSVVCGKQEYKAKSFILATGGVSHPETGSTGDGFPWLAQLGHTVLKPTPTIVPLAVHEQWVKELAGVSLSFMKITFFVNKAKKFSETGKILFTHFGISGPLILNIAHKVSDLLHDGMVTAMIDAFPDTNLGSLERRIIAVFDKNKNKMLKNVFQDIAPEGTSQSILALLKGSVDPEKKVHSVTKEERKAIVRMLKALPLTITGLMGYDRAVIADGGVPLAEIDMKTMRSKKIENLFIVGDLLNINRPSGGYSLQLCWTTGFVAGSHA
ncbi:MAG TPA: aminoacetone oxidase family FAD-binding enzyme [Candidatus Paceibacterota bacterium]